MKKYAIAAAIFAAFSAQAACYGTGTFRTCSDDSGNNYTVNRSGNATYVDGSNSQTGSTWSQQSYRSGNTTSTYGTSSDGSSWNAQTYKTPGGGSTTYGTDSKGNSFVQTCNRFGCY